MNEETSPVNVPQPGRVMPRPVLLSVICLFSLVFFSILSLLFIAAVLYSGWITDVTNQYIPDMPHSKSRVSLILIAGAFLHLLGLTGTLLIWRMQKRGYYMLGLSCLVISAFQAFQAPVSISMTAVYISIILLFGLFFRRLR